jgi:hypothetical protein
VTSVVTEDHERQLWEELNSLLADAVPDGAGEVDAEDLDAILFAVMGRNSELHALYERVRRLARDNAGYLRERLEEDNPIARVRRRVYGKNWA